jgi:hypothetical protein
MLRSYAIAAVNSAMRSPGSSHIRLSHASAVSRKRILFLLSRTPASQTEMIDIQSDPADAANSTALFSRRENFVQSATPNHNQ